MRRCGSESGLEYRLTVTRTRAHMFTHTVIRPRLMDLTLMVTRTLVRRLGWASAMAAGATAVTAAAATVIVAAGSIAAAAMSLAVAFVEAASMAAVTVAAGGSPSCDCLSLSRES